MWMHKIVVYPEIKNWLSVVLYAGYEVLKDYYLLAMYFSLLKAINF